jgi:hypothetical protein
MQTGFKPINFNHTIDMHISGIAYPYYYYRMNMMSGVC